MPCTRSTVPALLGTFLLLTAGSAKATSASPAGHGFGKVDFASSGAPAAQADFLDGLALLHDFEYPSAAEAFRRAEAIDPGFALAYWGEAMTFTHPVWMQQDLPAARAALNRLAPTPAERRAKAPTGRERAYLDAVEVLYGNDTNEPQSFRSGVADKEARDFAYEKAMADVAARYPDDIDAAAFYGLAILGTAHAGRDVPTYQRAAAVLEKAFERQPDHPGVLHYLIHSYDDPEHARSGLRAASLYARVAPDAGHAQHMTSHIFLALGMWQETIDANVAAMAAVDRMRAAKQLPPKRCGHYIAWLAYAEQQLGRFDDAKATLSACRTEAMDVKGSPDAAHSLDADDSSGAAFANLRLAYLVDSEDWTGDVAAWELPPFATPRTRLDFAFARALRALAGKDLAETKRAISDLEAVSREVLAIAKAQDDPNPTYRLRPEILLLEAQALLAEKRGRLDAAEKLARQATALEDALPIDFGPPTITKPTHELLGEMLQRHGRARALDEFARALALAPGRRLAAAGFAASAGSPKSPDIPSPATTPR
ncbi:MAG: hypothetical protein ABI639_11835 [Thermoanaerobaculia bacterium]